MYFQTEYVITFTPKQFFCWIIGSVVSIQTSSITYFSNDCSIIIFLVFILH